MEENCLRKRIRYTRTKEDPKKWISIQEWEHPTNGGLYKILLDESTQMFSILDIRAEMVFKKGFGSNMHRVKIKAKRELEKLGISFDEPEARKRVMR